MTQDQAKKDGAAVRIPPPVTGLLVIVAGYLTGRFVPILTAYELGTPGRYWAGAAIISSAVLVLAIWPIRLFRKIEQDPTPWSSTPEIIVHGPYQFSRNPMYLMMVFVCLGFAIIFSEAWIVIFTPLLTTALYHTAIKHEEAYLAEKFGDSYRNYKKTVRRWI